MSLKFLPALFLAAKLFLPVASVYGEERTLEFKISPEGTRLRPLGEAVALTVTALASDGRPAIDGWVALRLDAPPPGRFFSTDFPTVEGTELLEMRLPIVDGKVKWRQTFPIRGSYRLSAQFVNEGSVKARKMFHFNVHEHEQKWFLLNVFMLGLLAAGVIAGRIFTAPRRGRRAKLLLWLFLILMCFAAAEKTICGAAERGPRSFSKLEIGTATVGAPTRIHWALINHGGERQAMAQLTLTIIHLENSKVLFSLDKIPVAGEFSLRYQFADGTEHRVIAVAVTADGETVRQEETVPVTPLPPPLRAKLQLVSFFLAIIAVGLALGRWSRRGGRRLAG